MNLSLLYDSEDDFTSRDGMGNRKLGRRQNVSCVERVEAIKIYFVPMITNH